MTARMIRYDEKYASKIEELVELSNGEIEIIKDSNLEYDPYFYERKAQLDKTIEAVDNGTMKMYSQEEADIILDKFLEELETNYENN